MIIDCHTHLCSCGKDVQDRVTWAASLRALRQEFNDCGAQTAVLLPEFRTGHPDMPDTEATLKLVADVPSLYPLGSPDLEHLTAATIARLNHLLAQRKIYGLKLYFGYQHMSPADRSLRPLYQLAVQYDVPVLVHSGDTIGTFPGAKLQYAHPLHLDDVATEFPKLKIIIAHLGNPWISDCAEVVNKNPNVYADLSGLVEGKHCPPPLAALLRRQIRDFVAYTGARKLLYGSDWPIVPMRMYLRFVRSLPIPRAEWPWVLWRNAATLFKLPV